jgi:uncharacterized protein Yka (UPF0111/DUF47 family)
VSFHPLDPIYRRVPLRARAAARVQRRVDALLAYMDAHLEATRGTDATLRRLDDLEGEADRLRREL